ncbi:MAG: hypothetical protein CL842_03810 [Crocinitomicaceae bacterium]|nr:hypothetical protein [Crocinitomicaceae bacterium]|tara:strand:- start:32632 stop:33624 length:993 start_codon:yes stop_codon:yes gene_type:complete
MKKINLIVVSILTVFFADAQVAKKVLAEHFTNTKCSICASRNPGLIQNFNNNPDVLHVSVHPSAPYSDCFLNNHNPSENDARTNFYGLYGSTPKLVINGVIQPTSTNFGGATLFNNFTGDMSAISMNSEVLIAGSKLEIEVIVKVEAANSFNTEKLTVFLVEDTVFYDAPNGEKQHYNVFRKALTSEAGDDIVISQTTNDSVIERYSIDINSGWDLERMKVIAILQKSDDKTLIQADESMNAGHNAPAGLSQKKPKFAHQIYPSPASAVLNVEGLTTNFQYEILDSAGNTMQAGENYAGEPINVVQLKSGIHFIRVYNAEQHTVSKFLKE